MDTYVAAKSFKIKDESTGQIVQLKPGDPLPGDLPNAKRWVDFGYVIPADKAHLLRNRRAKGMPNVAVDPEGRPIPAKELAHFKAERDVAKISDKRLLLKKAARAQIDVSMMRHESEVRAALVEHYERHYDQAPLVSMTSPGNRKGIALDEGDDTANDEMYTEENLRKLKKAELETLGVEDFGLQFSSRATNDEMVAEIIGAPWTMRALAKLSVEKLVEIANDDFDLEMDETQSPGQLVPAILDAQSADGATTDDGDGDSDSDGDSDGDGDGDGDEDKGEGDDEIVA